MDRILTSSISDSAGLPILGRTLDFIQDSFSKQDLALAYSALNNDVDSVPIVLYGCIGTYSTVGFSNDTYTITKGAILYNDEIYQVPAMVATRASISETFVLRIDTSTYQVGEPTLYTDNVSRNTNQIRTIKVYNGLTGTGIVDIVNLKFLNRVETQNTTFGLIASNITATNTSSLSMIINAIKKGNTTTLHGFFNFVSNSTTPPIITLELQDNYKYNSRVNGCFSVNNVTVNLVGCGSIIGSNTLNISFNVVNPTTSGHQYLVSFNITYDNLNIG